MKYKTLTIFTPTYNRAYCLPDLYASLLKQNRKDFIWMIVDDGSTDETRNLIDEWKREGKIIIDYYYQENGGKMRAHNFAAQQCKTELFMCLDSDDLLTDNAVSIITDFWGVHRNDRKNLSGLLAPRKNVNEERSHIPENLPYATMQELYQHGYHGETAIAFRTEVIKQYPFPVQEGEKFISEIAAYDQIDEHYVMVTLDEPLMICEYREDGYSQNLLKINVKNPKGVVFVNLQRQRNIHRFSPTLMREYIAYSSIAGRSWLEIVHGNSYPLCCLLMLPLGYKMKKDILNQIKEDKL